MKKTVQLPAIHTVNFTGQTDSVARQGHKHQIREQHCNTLVTNYPSICVYDSRQRRQCTDCRRSRARAPGVLYIHRQGNGTSDRLGYPKERGAHLWVNAWEYPTFLHVLFSSGCFGPGRFSELMHGGIEVVKGIVEVFLVVLLLTLENRVFFACQVQCTLIRTIIRRI